MILQVKYIQEDFIVWIRSFCIKSLKKAQHNLHGLQKASREDAATYLLIWYLVVWHVTQHNWTISARITDTWGNRWCPGLASSPSRCTFTSAGRPSCPCRGPWRWNSVGKSELDVRQWQSEAMLKTNRTEGWAIICLKQIRSMVIVYYYAKSVAFFKEKIKNDSDHSNIWSPCWIIMINCIDWHLSKHLMWLNKGELNRNQCKSRSIHLTKQVSSV